jgi:hypothetical protein
MYKRIKERRKEPEQTPFLKTYESEASAAADKKRVRDSLKEWDYEESEPPKLPELINIEFLSPCFAFQGPDQRQFKTSSYNGVGMAREGLRLFSTSRSSSGTAGPTSKECTAT